MVIAPVAARAVALVVNLAATKASQSFCGKAVLLQALCHSHQSNNGANTGLQVTGLRAEPEANR